MTEPAPKLLDYLPAIYQEEPFLGQFLSAFEEILFGRTSDLNFPATGLEQTISQLPKLFDPDQTPEAFLTWLSEWVAFSGRADLQPIQQRAFIARVISLYRRRGTKENLQELLKIFVRGEPSIREPSGTEHFFEVEINIPVDLEPNLQARQIEIARALIELEKPAHTYYKLIPNVLSTIQIGRQSTIGKNTLLGTPPKTI